MKKLFLLLFFFVFYFSKSVYSQDNVAVDSLWQLSMKWEKEDSLGKWLGCHKRIHEIYRNKGLTDSSLFILSKAIEKSWRAPNTNTEIKNLAWTYVNRAYLFEHNLGNFLKAKSDYEKAFQLFHEIEKENFYITRYVWHPLGNIYTRLGENKQAIHFIRKSLYSYQELEASSHAADAYNDLGLIYMNTGEPQKAIEAFDKGIAINSPGHNGLIYSNKANAFLVLEEFSQGIQAVEKSILLLEEQENNPLKENFLIGAHTRYGTLLSHVGIYKEAEIQFEKALRYKDVLASIKHRKIASIYIGMAENSLLLEDQTQAAHYFQKAIIQCISSFDDPNLQTNPQANQLAAEINLGRALVGKAKTAKLLYEKNRDTSWLLIAQDCFELYFEWEKLLRAEYHYEASKLLFTKELHQTAESVIELLLQLQELNVKGKWAEKAFQYIEQTKGILLSESMVRASVSIPQLINDSELVELNLYQKQLQMSKTNLQFTTTYDSLLKVEELQRIEVKVQLLEQVLLERYPSLYEFKSNSNTEISLSLLTQFLQTQQANLISYFLGDSIAVVTIFSKGRFSLKKLDRNRINHAFDRLYSQLHALNNQSVASYEKAAYRLYQEVISPIESLAKQERWIIIPDGKLNELPFETLVRREKTLTSFKKLDYLLLHKQVSYSPSVKFLLLPTSGQTPKLNYLGIAPNFKNTALLPLKFAEQEVRVGESIFNGHLLLDAAANKEEVLGKLPHYRVIHLVSHAQKGEKVKEQAWVALSSEKDKLSKLYPPELIPLRLSTQLLILNACETGSGTYHAGEGTFSLARNFLHSGTQNVITNLWQANHAVNSEIFSQFYSTLDDNYGSISSALTQAKRHYLKKQSTDELGAHPYYWGSLILTGNNMRLAEIRQPNRYILEFVVGIIVTLIIVLFALKYKK